MIHQNNDWWMSGKTKEKKENRCKNISFVDVYFLFIRLKKPKRVSEMQLTYISQLETAGGGLSCALRLSLLEVQSDVMWQGTSVVVSVVFTFPT